MASQSCWSPYNIGIVGPILITTCFLIHDTRRYFWALVNANTQKIKTNKLRTANTCFFPIIFHQKRSESSIVLLKFQALYICFKPGIDVVSCKPALSNPRTDCFQYHAWDTGSDLHWSWLVRLARLWGHSNNMFLVTAHTIASSLSRTILWTRCDLPATLILPCHPSTWLCGDHLVQNANRIDPLSQVFSK